MCCRASEALPRIVFSTSSRTSGTKQIRRKLRYQGHTEGVGFEPTVRLPVRLISSQVPSTNSATLPLRPNQGREDSVNCRLVDDLVSLHRSQILGLEICERCRLWQQNSRLRRKFYCLLERRVLLAKNSRRNNRLAPRSASQHSCILEYLSSFVLLLIDLLLLRVPFFLTEVLVVIGELVHGSAEEAH